MEALRCDRRWGGKHNEMIERRWTKRKINYKMDWARESLPPYLRNAAKVPFKGALECITTTWCPLFIFSPWPSNIPSPPLLQCTVSAITSIQFHPDSSPSPEALQYVSCHCCSKALFTVNGGDQCPLAAGNIWTRDDMTKLVRVCVCSVKM